MLVKVYGASVRGLSAIPVTIEVNASRGIKFFLVGLPDNAVKESHERIVAAVENSGYRFPSKQFVVNMAPADIRKEGAGYDLPLAVGILATDEKVKPDKLSRTMMLGELSLDGSLQPVKGALPIAIKAREMGFEYLIVPRQNVREAAVVNRLKVYGASHIGEVVRFLNDEGGLIPTEIDTRAEFYAQQTEFDFDFADVKGQEHVKRALEVAAAGGHNVIMIGLAFHPASSVFGRELGNDPDSFCGGQIGAGKLAHRPASVSCTTPHDFADRFGRGWCQPTARRSKSGT